MILRAVLSIRKVVHELDEHFPEDKSKVLVSALEAINMACDLIEEGIGITETDIQMDVKDIENDSDVEVRITTEGAVESVDSEQTEADTERLRWDTWRADFTNAVVIMGAPTTAASGYTNMMKDFNSGQTAEVAARNAVRHAMYVAQSPL